MQLIAWVLSSLLSEAILWMPQNRTADNDDSDDNDDFTDTKCTAKVKNVKKFWNQLAVNACPLLITYQTNLPLPLVILEQIHHTRLGLRTREFGIFPQIIQHLVVVTL